MATHTRSFRLSEQTSHLLDDLSERSSESRNALAERLLGEALHTADHPLIRFRTGAAGRRQAALAGTRLYVHQVMATVRASDNSVPDAADYLGLEESYVRAAVAYYASFGDEIDADADFSARVAADEHDRWTREQQALA